MTDPAGSAPTRFSLRTPHNVFTVANAITFTRAGLFFVFWYLVATGKPVAGVIVFFIAWALDAVDGWVARKLGQASQLGSHLDKLVDRLSMGFGMVILVRYGVLPPAALLLLTREIGALPTTFPVQRLAHNWQGAGRIGKVNTLLQGLALLWLLLNWPYQAAIIAVVAALGVVTAVAHLRRVFVVVFMAVAVPLSAQASVILNELMWDGVEYIELYNTGEGTSLSGWKLTRQQADKEEKTILVFENGVEIANGGYVLIEKNENATSIPADVIATSLTLVNTGELVRLYNGDGQVVDTAGQFGSWPAGQNTETGIAMERIGDGWQTSSGSGGGRDGTPRAANSSGQSQAAESDEQSSNTSYSTAVIINELLPNPEGDDATGEFIELYNPSDQTADLSGWQIDDATGGSKAYTLPSGTTVAGKEYLVLHREETGVALNNGGDDARLLDPNGQVHTSVTYNDTAANGRSYSRVSGGFQWSTTPTPGSANVVTQPAVSPTKQPTARASTKPTATVAAATTGGPYSQSVVIWRALPNPDGEDAAGEYIELKNTGSTPVDLTGWQLDDEDGGSQPYTIPDGTVIAGGATLAFTREDTNIALNNNRDSVRLLFPDGTVADSLDYDDVREGEVIAVSSEAMQVAQVAGTTQAAAEVGAEPASIAATAASGAPQAVAQLTAGARSDTQADSNSDNSATGIVIGVALLIAAGGAAAVAFGNRETARQVLKRMFVRRS